MWGYVRNIVLAENISDLNEVWRKVYSCVALITLYMLHCTWHETECHLDICRATNSTDVEIY
jgi:hypothetical protein